MAVANQMQVGCPVYVLALEQLYTVLHNLPNALDFAIGWPASELCRRPLWQPSVLYEADSWFCRELMLIHGIPRVRQLTSLHPTPRRYLGAD
jgi:hypothetical protein